MKHTTLALLSFAAFLAPAAKAEMLDLYIENTSTGIASFKGGVLGFDRLSLGTLTEDAVPFQVSYSSAPALTGLVGDYEGRFVLGDISYFSGAQVASLTPQNGLFSLSDNAGGFLTGTISDGELFRTARRFDLRLTISSLVYSGPNDALQSLAQAEGVSVELPVYFETAIPSLLSLKTPGSEQVGLVYDGYLSSCTSVIPETPWYALALGLGAAGYSWIRRSRQVAAA